MFGIPFGAWKLIAVAALVAALGGYIGWLKWSIADLEAELATTVSERDEARGAASRNAAELVRVSDEKAATAKRVASAEARVSAEIRRRDELLKTISREVYRAPTVDSCPLPPAIAAALDGVRAARAPGAAARGAGGEAGGARSSP